MARARHPLVLGRGTGNKPDMFEVFRILSCFWCNAPQRCAISSTALQGRADLGARAASGRGCAGRGAGDEQAARRSDRGRRRWPMPVPDRFARRTSWAWPQSSALAGAAGAMVAHLIPAEVLRIIMPVVLIGVAAFFALKPGLTDDARVARMKPAVFAVAVVPAIAAYDGFFGPGTGSFFMIELRPPAGGRRRAESDGAYQDAELQPATSSSFWSSSSRAQPGGRGLQDGTVAQVAGAALGARDWRCGWRRAADQAASRMRLDGDGLAASVAGLA